MSNTNHIKTLADILKQIPSPFREDYPKSVPAYIVRDWASFDERYKGQIGNIRGEFKKQQKVIEELLKQLDICADDFATMNMDTSVKRIHHVLERYKA